MSIQNQINEALDNVDEFQYRTRLNICNRCPKLNKLRICTECICPVDIKNKLKSQKCPLGHWA